MGEARSEDPNVARFGGASADFVASLGRKGAELRALATAPLEGRARDELRRKLHALGVGARLLHFDVLAHAIAAATEDLDRSASAARADQASLARLHRLFDSLPELALARTLPKELAPAVEPPPKKPALPRGLWPVLTVLVVGEPMLAHVLESVPDELGCEVERTTAVGSAIALARALAPDVVVVDGALEGAGDLVEALGEDALTGPVPVIVVEDHVDSTTVARHRARGASAVVARGEPSALRKICAETTLARSRSLVETLHPEIGDVTVGQLAERLSHEIRRALVEAVDPAMRDAPISLGLGADVLGPLWGALARVRDVAAARSEGRVRFRQDVVAPAIVAAVGAVQPPPTRVPSAKKATSAPRLDRHRVLVVDDDVAVVDYVSAALGAAGAQLDRAGDGREAMARARLRSPDAVVSDVLMPGMDGIALARALRRDVVLRDRPIVLLSWKEDLLARMRDLGAGAAALLRKESDAATLAAEVAKVLAPRARLAERLSRGGEVQGRLDDCTSASLLALVGESRPAASVLLRDATYAFEVELEAGGIRRLGRIDAAGARLFGDAVLPSLLGAGSGRFLVRDRVRGDGPEMPGSLAEQIAPSVARLRASADVVALPNLRRLVLDESEVFAYAPACTPAIRDVLERISEGESPAALIASGGIAPSALEDLLLDLAARGMLLVALDDANVDLLAKARSIVPPPPSPEESFAEFSAPPPEVTVDLGLDLDAPETASSDGDRVSALPASLEDAVLLTVDAGSAPVVARSIVDARELRPRVMRSDPPGREGARASSPSGTFSATPTPRPEARTSSVPPSSGARGATLSGVGPSSSAEAETPPSVPSAKQKPRPPEDR
jgi:CheY-like chemotaxis protein